MSSDESDVYIVEDILDKRMHKVRGDSDSGRLQLLAGPSFANLLPGQA